MKGCTVLAGHARFEGPDRVRVGDDVLTAPRIFINVGGRPSVPPTSRRRSRSRSSPTRSILALDRVPEHLRGRGRQLHRPRVRADAPALRRRGDGHRDGSRGSWPRGSRTYRMAIREILEAEGIDGADGGRGASARDARARRGGGRRLRRRPARGGRLAPPAGGGPAAEHRRPGPRPRRRGHRRRGLRHGRRLAGHERPRNLGAGRLQRPRRLHAHGVQRLRDRGREPARRPVAQA